METLILTVSQAVFGCLFLLFFVLLVVVGRKVLGEEPQLSPPARKADPPKPASQQARDTGPELWPRWTMTRKWGVVQDKRAWDRDFEAAEAAEAARATEATESAEAGAAPSATPPPPPLAQPHPEGAGVYARLRFRLDNLQ